MLMRIIVLKLVVGDLESWGVWLMAKDAGLLAFTRFCVYCSLDCVRQFVIHRVFVIVVSGLVFVVCL